MHKYLVDQILTMSTSSDIIKNNVYIYPGSQPVNEIKPLELLSVLQRMEKRGSASIPILVSRTFWDFRFFRHQSVLFRRQVIQGFMRPLAVIFTQPTLRNLPGFIQCPEQIKIQDFCPVRSVKTLDKRILCRLAGLINSGNTPCSSARCASASETSSAPLSIRIFSG